MSPALLALLGLFAVAAPLLLDAFAPALVSSSYGASHARFELLGFSGALALLALALREVRRRPRRGARELAAVLAPLAVALHALVLVTESTRRPFDYDCYEYAGRVLLAGGDPYREGLLYLYPPLTAELFAGAFRAVRGVGALLGAGPLGDESVWELVFYLYQCAQVALAAWLALLLGRFGRRMGLATPWAELLAAALLVFGNPLLRTLRHGQLNLWVVDLALAGVLAAAARPALAGAALGLAAQLKLYPLALGVPLTVAGRWRAALWMAAAFAAVVGFETRLLADLSLWTAFLSSWSGVGGEVAYRNASLHSIAYNTLRLLGAPELAAPVARGVARVAALGALLWLVLRSLARERARRASRIDAEPAFLASAADALGLALVASPSAWEHHFLLATPLVVAAAALHGAERPVGIALAAFLMLGMPTFDLYPFGYHRLAGLLLLLALAPAARGSAHSRSIAKRSQ